jgi:transcriptional regulator with XRE-family HTH domain
MSVRKLIEIDLAKVEKLAGLGLSEKQVAEGLGISQRTLERRKNSEDFKAALSKGKARAIAKVANWLYELCAEKNLGAIIWYEKTRSGFSDHLTLSGDQENPLLVATRDSIAGFAPGSVGDSTSSGADSDPRSRPALGQNRPRGRPRRD